MDRHVDKMIEIEVEKWRSGERDEEVNNSQLNTRVCNLVA